MIANCHRTSLAECLMDSQRFEDDGMCPSPWHLDREASQLHKSLPRPLLLDGLPRDDRRTMPARRISSPPESPSTAQVAARQAYGQFQSVRIVHEHKDRSSAVLNHNSQYAVRTPIAASMYLAALGKEPTSIEARYGAPLIAKQRSPREGENPYVASQLMPTPVRASVVRERKAPVGLKLSYAIGGCSRKVCNDHSGRIVNGEDLEGNFMNRERLRGRQSPNSSARGSIGHDERNAFNTDAAPSFGSSLAERIAQRSTSPEPSVPYYGPQYFGYHKGDNANTSLAFAGSRALPAYSSGFSAHDGTAVGAEFGSQYTPLPLRVTEDEQLQGANVSSSPVSPPAGPLREFWRGGTGRYRRVESTACLPGNAIPPLFGPSSGSGAPLETLRGPFQITAAPASSTLRCHSLDRGTVTMRSRLRPGFGDAGGSSLVARWRNKEESQLSHLRGASHNLIQKISSPNVPHDAPWARSALKPVTLGLNYSPTPVSARLAETHVLNGSSPGVLPGCKNASNFPGAGVAISPGTRSAEDASNKSNCKSFGAPGAYLGCGSAEALGHKEVVPNSGILVFDPLTAGEESRTLPLNLLLTQAVRKLVTRQFPYLIKELEAAAEVAKPDHSTLVPQAPLKSKAEPELLQKASLKTLNILTVADDEFTGNISHAEADRCYPQYQSHRLVKQLSGNISDQPARQRTGDGCAFPPVVISRNTVGSAAPAMTPGNFDSKQLCAESREPGLTVPFSEQHARDTIAECPPGEEPFKRAVCIKALSSCGTAGSQLGSNNGSSTISSPRPSNQRGRSNVYAHQSSRRLSSQGRRSPSQNAPSAIRSASLAPARTVRSSRSAKTLSPAAAIGAVADEAISIVKDFKTGALKLSVKIPATECIPRRDVTLLELLSNGTFGCVYKALWRRSSTVQTFVAVKQPLTANPNSASRYTLEQLRSIQREINAYRSVAHPHIVKYFGVIVNEEGCGETSLWLVTEFLPGGNLFDLLFEDAITIDGATRLKMAKQLTEGLVYLHAQKPCIVHRDVKTANLVLDDELNVKICDFGKTRRMVDRHLVLEDNGGSPRYMAPESFWCGGSVDEKTDIWALGCCLIEIFGGPIPHEELLDNQSVINKVWSEKGSPRIPSHFIPSLRECLKRCLNWIPARRPTAADVLAVLRKLNVQDLESAGMNRRTGIQQPAVSSLCRDYRGADLVAACDGFYAAAEQ